MLFQDCVHRGGVEHAPAGAVDANADRLDVAQRGELAGDLFRGHALVDAKDIFAQPAVHQNLGGGRPRCGFERRRSLLPPVVGQFFADAAGLAPQQRELGVGPMNPR